MSDIGGAGGGSVALGTQSRLQPALASALSIPAVQTLAVKKILFVGNSRTSGAVSLANCSGGWMGYLASLLGPLIGIPANVNNSPVVHAGLSIPTSLGDPRWSLGAGWVYNNLSLALGWAAGHAGGGALFIGSGATGNLVYNQNGNSGTIPAFTTKSYDVYYATAVSGGGTGVTFTATGGAAVPVTINTGVAGVARANCAAASALTTNTCSITQTAGTTVIFGVEPHLDLASELLLGQAGVNSAGALDWNASGSSGRGVQDAIALINLYNPDIVVWELFAEDAFVGNSIPTIQAQLTQLINSTVGPSKSIFMTMTNIGPGSGLGPAAPALLPPYMQALRDLGKSLGIPVIDLDQSWGGIQAFTLLSSLYSGDQLHPNIQGYAVQARYIAQALAGMLGTM